MSLSPLLQNTQRIIADPRMDHNVRNGIKRLLGMTTCSLNSQYLNFKLRSSGNLKEKQKIDLNLLKNYETNIGVSNRNIENLRSYRERVINKNMVSFHDDNLYGRNVEKSSYFAPNPKVQMKGKLVPLI